MENLPHNDNKLRIKLSKNVNNQNKKIICIRERDDSSYFARNERVGAPRNSKMPNFAPPIRLVEEMLDEQQKFNRSSELFSERLSLEEVKVHGGQDLCGDDYKISCFSECGLSTEISRNLYMWCYDKPTPVQKYVIPLIQNTQKDILCLGSTGSGKTGSFLIPIINQLQHESGGPRQVNRNRPRAIVVTHTKELVQQLCENARLLASNTGVGIALAQGAMSLNDSLQQLRAGCDILVCTPGRLKQYMNGSICGVGDVQFVVVDEADKFFSEPDFVDALRTLVQKMEDSNNSNWRMSMFSATVTEEAHEKMEEFLRDDFILVQVGETNQTVPHVPLRICRTQGGRVKRLIMVEHFLKLHAVQKPGPNEKPSFGCEKTLIFVNEGRQCDRLAIALCDAGFRANSVNGKRTSAQRYAAVQQFKDGDFDILVGTDVLARGLNLPDVARVILYDLPLVHHYAQFIHRVGRTGRLGNEGEAIVLFEEGKPNDVQLARFLVAQLNSVKQAVPKWLNGLARDEEHCRMVAQSNGARGTPHWAKK